jgi:HEAT repeat protein
MATEEAWAHPELLAALDARDWSVTLQAVAVADTRIRGSIVGDPKVEEIVAKLVALASHTKWEVRRAVGQAAAHAPHPIFERVLAKLALDDNGRVRQAAENAALRRRDSRHASTLGKQHEDRINATLDDIEARFGSKGRDAVKRAAEQIANTFARELYHEVIKLVSPLLRQPTV